ncbi:MAG: tetratricopeptide repeat protein, partial [Myxococcales bacterium]|nr:tetratricopeptide repeat protein [Myxococcales bacterium]
MSPRRSVRAAAAALGWLALSLCAALASGCVYGRSAPDESKVALSLRELRDRDAPSLALSDALEALVAEGRDGASDREFTYWVISQRPMPKTAEDAFARAAAAGRVAQLKGLNAPDLIRELEHYARLSRSFDDAFREGAAQRMLGTLYVYAPAYMVQHGDSETGIELLEELAERYPGNAENRLHLAEAYAELGDPDPARPHLCFADAHRGALRTDDVKLLDH